MTHPDRFLLSGVMGYPVMHSRSPKLHDYWLAKYGLTGTYVPLTIKAERLRAALRALPALGFSGCNLTIPHKEAALAIVDKVDPLACRIGAVNCIVIAADGSLTGQNHDAFGYIESVREAQPTGPAKFVWSIARWHGARSWRAKWAARSRRWAGGNARRRSRVRRCWSTPPTRGWWASRRSTLRSIACRRARSCPTSSIFRARPRCSRPRASAATRQ